MAQLRRAQRSSTHSCARNRAVALAVLLLSVPVTAQDEPRVFAGALYGVSALSADARSEITGSTAAVSLYEPKNGPALNVFAGVHIAQYFSVQANWMWNSNDLTLTSSFTTPQTGAFYEQHRDSRQHAVVLDGLIYFRRVDSAIRPYLGTGLSVLHFSSDEITAAPAQGLPAPSHVGIDFRLSRRLAFRYSFSETISANPVSPSLTPQGRRGLMNFQNLFGFVGRF
jgi:hypothetical protein